MKAVWTVLAACALAAAAVPAGAAGWSELFASVQDTVVFIGADGALLRAPFSLATRETLWAPPDGQRLVRMRVSPDGRRVAWITRGGDRDTTRLWVEGPSGSAVRMRYFAFEPQRYGQIHSESGVPSIEDPEARGGRLVQPSALMRRVASNSLEWTPDSRALVFGYDDGIAAVPADGGSGFIVSKAFAVKLESLEPAPVYLVSAIVLRDRLRYLGQPGGTNPADIALPMEDGRPIYDSYELSHLNVLESREAYPGTYLLYPMARRWRVFTAADLASGRLRAASPGTVWWAVGTEIHAVRTHDPNATEEVHAGTGVTWLGDDESHRALVWAAGREVRRKPEDGGAETVVLSTGTPVRAGLDSRTGRDVALVTSDSLVLWDPRDDSARSFALAGLKPSALYEGPGGQVLVATSGGRGEAPGLARADTTTGRLEAVEAPPLKNGLFTAVAKGAYLLLCDPAPKPPDTLQVYDVAAGRWQKVENPGIAGWEPLDPR